MLRKDDNMKSVLLKVKPEHWEMMRTQQKTLHVDRARPMGVELPVRVIVCVTKPAGKIVGEFLAAHFLRRSSVGGLAARSRVPLQELIAYADGGEVFAWTIDDVVEYETPMALAALGVKRAPQSWMYVEVDDLWP